MKYYARYMPWAAFSLGVLCLIVAAIPPHDSEGALRLNDFGLVPVQEGGRVKPIDTLARNSLTAIGGRSYYVDADGRSQPATRWLLDVVSSSFQPPDLRTSKDPSDKKKTFRIDNAEARTILGLTDRPDHLYSFDEFRDKAEELVKVAAGRVQKAHGGGAASSDDDRLIEIAQQIMAYSDYRQYETTARVFRIENDQVLDLLGLEPRPGFRYSFAEITPRVFLLTQASKRTGNSKEPQDVFHTKIDDLGKQINVYEKLANYSTLRIVPPPPGKEDWSTLGDALQSLQQGAGRRDPGSMALIVMLRGLRQGNDEMFRKASTAYQSLDSEKDVTPAQAVVAMLLYYDRARSLAASHDLAKDEDARKEYDLAVASFNKSLTAYQFAASGSLPPDAEKVHLEAFFNHFAPFLMCAYLYVGVFLLACGGFLMACTGRREWAVPLNQSAFLLAVLTLVVHTVALGTRMYLTGRPPVTNLYSSAVFIGWGCVVLGLGLEILYRIGIGNLVASVCGSLTLIIAHYLAIGGDTLNTLEAVLDTNFWLATHVVCVTLGYTATFFAGKLGVLYILLGLFSPWLNRKVSGSDQTLGRIVAQMTYGVVCFATLLSFVGTVLGGIWADQSWGRFWGWDPKENGALIIVLWNALVLHARWGGMVKQRGMAVLAVGGNIVTAWSWFGVNMLGVGLHSYGFMEGAVWWLLAYVLSQLVIIGLGLIPLRQWRSFGPQAAAPIGPAPTPVPPPAEPEEKDESPEPASTAVTTSPSSGKKGRRQRGKQKQPTSQSK